MLYSAVAYSYSDVARECRSPDLSKGLCFQEGTCMHDFRVDNGYLLEVFVPVDKTAAPSCSRISNSKEKTKSKMWKDLTFRQVPTSGLYSIAQRP